MSAALYSLGSWAVRARRVVLLAWSGVLVLVALLAGLLQGGLDDQVTIPGTESQAALDHLAATFPQVSGASAQLIVVAPDGSTVEDAAVQGPVEDAVGTIGDLDQVTAVTSPYDDQAPAAVSDDDRASLLTIQLDADPSAVTDATVAALEDAAADLAAALPDGAQSALGGQLFSTSFPSLSVTEALGLLVALVVLVVTFGSFVAAGMPLLNALVGVGTSMGLLFAATSVATINSTTPMLAVMLGLAVGIDYALFVVSRHRDQLQAGLAVEESVARAVATAGSAVIFAGLTVMIALVGLGVAGIPFLTTMGLAAAVGVGLAVLVSLTLLPAMLGFAGERLRPRTRRPRRRRGRRAQPPPPPPQLPPTSPLGTVVHRNRFFAGWVRTVTRVPALTIAVVLAVLVLLTIPAKDLRLALPDAGSLPEGDPARVTYDLVSEHFGPGYNGPLVVTGTVVTSTDPVGLMDALGDEIAGLPGVADVPLSTPNPAGDTGIVQVIPTGGPDSDRTKDLVREIRAQHDHFLDEYGVDLAVTGATAVGIDVSAKLGAALLPFALVVVGLSLVLLTMVFRSVAVPVKATVGYLFSVGVAFGVVTLVFEHGFLADALGVTKLGPVISFMPIVLMGVLFGLAMDYEVFLVSRIREDYVHSRDARGSVTTGFQGSAKVVTAAAIIMFAVFSAFVPDGDMNLKPIALGLAVGVVVDAFLVRMMLVPAVLALLGDRAWWIPRRLDRALPSFDVEGEGLARELALRDWPEPGADDAVVAHELVVAGRDGPLAAPVTVRVPQGEALVVHGTTGAAVSAVLLALAGRVRPSAGALKVTGLVLPERASTVRRRVAVVDLAADVAGLARDVPALAAHHGRAAATVDTAAAGRPRVLVVTGTDVVAAPDERAALARSLARAAAAGTSVVVGALGPAGAGLLPAGALLLDLEPPAPPRPLAAAVPALPEEVGA